MAELTDNELIKRMQQGDTGALGILYMRYAPSVSRFAYRFIRVREDIDDITHNIFCSLWENRASLKNPDSLKAYLFMMTRNAIFKAYKHDRVVSEYEAEVLTEDATDSKDAERIVTAKDLLEMIELRIADMPEIQREVFRMSRYDHLTYAEIAEKLGVSPKTVQYYISQALAELRKLTEAMIIFTTIDAIEKLNF